MRAFTLWPRACEVADEGFESIGDELDRPTERDRRGDRRHLVAIRVDLEAEAAAHVRRDHAHARLRQAEMPRDDPLHHVDGLRGMPDRELLLRGIVIGEDAARLERHRGVARGFELDLDDVIGARERVVDAGRLDDALVAEVVCRARGV